MINPKASRYFIYIKPVIQNPTLRSAAPHIFSLVSIIIFTLFALKPTISTILNLQKDIDNNREVYAALEQKGRNLTEGKRNLENLGTETNNKIKGSIPDQANVTSLINSLKSSIDREASIAALQIQPVTIYDASVKPGDQFSTAEIEFSLSVRGNFSQLVKTIDGLHKSSRLIELRAVTISKQQEGSPVLSVTGKGYYLK